MPKNQFDEDELFFVRDFFSSPEYKLVILSGLGQEAVGNKKTRFTPDGMIVDWNKHLQDQRKYDAVIVTGGKGAKKSLWDDPILPQILTDHHRAGSVVATSGMAAPVLGSSSLAQGEVAAPGNEDVVARLNDYRLAVAEEGLVSYHRVVSARDASVMPEFCEAIRQLL